MGAGLAPQQSRYEKNAKDFRFNVKAAYELEVNVFGLQNTKGQLKCIQERARPINAIP